MVGTDCKFAHPSATGSSQTVANPQNDPNEPSTNTPGRPRLEGNVRPTQRQAVLRPMPKAQTEDPRAFQIGQIQRRFKPGLGERDGVSVFTFKMKPSDPDFPYEIEDLECALSVPSTYPATGRPTLQVMNKDIPRGFQINIERGFDIIVTDAPESTLLGLMNRLDRQLETILAGRMADTIKLVANKGPSPKPAAVLEKARPPPPVVQPKVASTPNRPTVQQKDEAKATRHAHTRQLEARFGRLQAFVKPSDGTTYTLPLESPKKATWPVSLQALRSFRMIVPDLYPLEKAAIVLESDAPEARNVEWAFERLPTQMKTPTLTQLVNHLTQHIPDMAVTPAAANLVSSAPMEKAVDASAPVTVDTKKPVVTAVDEERPHVQHIPRPPEWDYRPEADEDSEDETDSDELESSGDSDGEGVHDQPSADEGAAAIAPAERGVLLSFPHLELHGIELLELVSLNITIKCERCKDTMDVQRLRNYTGEASAMRQETCKKCACGLAVGFRRDLVHVNSVRAGYLDLEGCTVIDLLPSNFTPTCSECSTPYPAPGVVAVRGDSSMAICRECHQKMTFRIPEVKFLRISPSAMRASRAVGRKKVKENLGITVGSELPRRGRCSHYSKSYRWFRFSCCSKVFPCDRCHDEQSDHPNEHANRMLCGFCSREQNYRPEDCGICHAVLVGKRGQGFWEGGKGTRDPTRMSKKDPRKYKRRPGTKPKT
ncbi:hypothetical protein LTR85_002613 [Meristemomyces frigidus]|nr:hypothetical protein LTR85_002613 [Meristemomyces frigidus]